MTTICYHKVAPTTMVVWFNGRFYRFRDAERGQAKKADTLYLQVSYEASDMDKLLEQPYKLRISTPRKIVKFEVNGETLLDGPARYREHLGRKKPEVIHCVIEAIND